MQHIYLVLAIASFRLLLDIEFSTIVYGKKAFMLSSSSWDMILSCFVQRGFEQQWLSVTFSKAIFLGNGLVAILSGLFGNVLVDNIGLGPVAPFDAAACFLVIGMAIILSSWTENYGDPSENKGLLTQFKGAATAIASGAFLTLLYIQPLC